MLEKNKKRKKMLEKNKKLLIGGAAGALVTGTILAIVLPLTFDSNASKALLFEWDKPIPTAPIYQKEGGLTSEYTTDITKGKGYVKGVNPKMVSIPKPTSKTDTIVVDGKIITAVAGAKTWSAQPPAGPYYPATGSDANKFVTDKTTSKGFIPAKDAVKPKIRNTIISNMGGGEAYDSSNWSWEEKTPGTVGNDGEAEVKPTMDGTIISGGTGGDVYSASNWTWEKKTAGSAGTPEVAEKKPTMNGVELSSLAGGTAYDPNAWTWEDNSDGTPGTDSIDETKPQIYGKEISSITGGITYDPSKWSWNLIKKGDPGSVKEEKVLPKFLLSGVISIPLINTTPGQEYDPGLWTYIITSPKTKVHNGQFRALYDGVQVAQNIIAPSSGIPANGTEFLPNIKGAQYKKGHMAHEQVDQTPDRYEAFYNGLATGKMKDIPYLSDGGAAGAKPTGAPADFVESSDYVKGRAKVDQTNGIPKTFTAKYKGVKITGWTKSVAYTGSIAGTPPTNEVPTEYQTNKYVKGEAHKAAVDQVNKIFTPKYNNTEITSFNLSIEFSATDPTTNQVPKQYKADSYVAGSPAVTEDNGTSFTYVAKYNGIETTYTKNVDNVGSKKGDAPSGVPGAFDESTNYTPGNIAVLESVPDPITIDIATKSKGDKITVNDVEYTVQQGIGYPDDTPTIVYKKGSEFVTDITKADGYKAKVNPTSVIPTNGKKDGDKIEIDGIEYVWQSTNSTVPTSAPTTDATQLYI